MLGWIYCWRCSENGKRYIGQTIKTVRQRWKQHLKAARRGSNTRFHCAIRTHGENAFKLEWSCAVIVRKVICCSSRIKTSLDEAEVQFIEQWNSIEDGYNETRGGCGTSGWLNSVEKRVAHARKIAAGITVTAVEHARRSSAWLHDSRRETYKLNRDQGSVAYWAKTSKLDHAIKCGLGDLEHARKSRPKSVCIYPVFCVELNRTFENACEATRALCKQGYNVTAGNIRQCVRGKRKTCGGLRWIRLT